MTEPKKLGTITSDEKDKLFQLYMATQNPPPLMMFGDVSSVDIIEKALETYQIELALKYNFNREKCVINESGDILEL